MTLSWSAAETGYVLESSTAVGTGAAWSVVEGTPSPANGRFRLAVSPVGQARFYRLRRAEGDAVTRIAGTSPVPGETGVAVTREAVFRLNGALAGDAALSAADLHAVVGDRRLLVRPEISSDRRTATLFYLENVPGNTRVRVTLNGNGLLDASGKALDADGDGQPGGVYVLEYDTAGTFGMTNTGVIGKVFASEKNPDGSNRPLENVTVTVDGAEETLRAVTDATGAFVLSPAPTGRFFVHVDGRTAVGSQWPGGAYYPFVGKAWEALPGVMTNLAGGNGEIFLPLIQSDALKSVSATSETKVTFSPSVLATNPALAGVEVAVPANALFSDSGVRGGRVGIAPVAPDRLPEPLPPGLNFPLVITVQTDGASNFDRPVPVRFPNLPDPVTGVKPGPGAKTVLWSFNHDTGRWEPQGLMTISADGQFAVSDPGTGIRQPGWHGVSPGTEGNGPRRRRGGPDSDGDGDGDGDGNEDCEGDDCECTQEIVCVVQKEGKNVARCALECLGNVVDDIFGDGPKPERTAFETGLRCIGGPDKCPGRPEDTLDRKRLDCMDECTDPEDDRIVYVMPCEGFTSPCGSSPALHGPALHAEIANLLPDRMVEQRKFWEVEGDFLVKLTGTPKILESDSSEVRRITDFFDSFADRVRADSASGIALSAAERSELVSLPRPT
ncbi:MAG: carboxypeptidase-like regulatory domain-containing protein, partial [Nitrospira sp.]|nr:carboxypeptidase-like regulatory domain-containing protein [Nitrospira sp.]